MLPTQRKKKNLGTPKSEMLTFSNPIYKKVEPTKSLLKSAQRSPYGYSEPKLQTGLDLSGQDKV